MNMFRFVADMLHLTAILILIYRIRKSRNCIGKSLLFLSPSFPYFEPAVPLLITVIANFLAKIKGVAP